MRHIFRLSAMSLITRATGHRPRNGLIGSLVSLWMQAIACSINHSFDHISHIHVSEPIPFSATFSPLLFPHEASSLDPNPSCTKAPLTTHPPFLSLVLKHKPYILFHLSCTRSFGFTSKLASGFSLIYIYTMPLLHFHASISFFF